MDWTRWTWLWIGLFPLYLLVVLTLAGKRWREVDPHAVYRARGRAIGVFLLGQSALYYAAGVVVSLSLGHVPSSWGTLHLALWTLGPPAWFFLEWFVYFDNHDDEKAVARLRTAQELASRFWAGVLALMISYRLSDIVKTAIAGLLVP